MVNDGESYGNEVSVATQYGPRLSPLKGRFRRPWRRKRPGKVPRISKAASRVKPQHFFSIVAGHTLQQTSLVGGFFSPLWKIWKSIGMIIPNIWENKKCSRWHGSNWAGCFDSQPAAKKSGEFKRWSFWWREIQRICCLKVEQPKTNRRIMWCIKNCSIIV